MEPEDFFKTAELLNSHRDEEANVRTSISRSYYGIFLYFREYLSKHGICKTKKPKEQVHDFLRDVLRYSNSTEGSILGDILGDLSQRRKDADYELARKFTPEDGEDALCIAQGAISDYVKIDPAEEKKLLANAKKRVRFHW
jgi:hypothetical protein